MPRISELPNAQPLTGNELVTLVQNGETRKAALTDLLNAPQTARASNARWITYTGNSSGIINDDLMEISLSSSGGC
jgi:hypothetical protein